MNDDAPVRLFVYALAVGIAAWSLYVAWPICQLIVRALRRHRSRAPRR
jgi:hypothetical protein